MSVAAKTTVPADQLPIIPETQPVEPLVRCGVLYLGTAPTSADVYGLDSIQEPLSHRYPVDGTNTVRGIDAILSVFDNGIQMEFTRQSRVAIFFPLTSLIYCASVRYSIIENVQTKLTSKVDWRFMPLDALTVEDDKHPPLFCSIIRRTQVLPGNECHCFITKSTHAALSLVQTITQVYAKLKAQIKYLRSPIFYQIDYFGRKLGEVTGVIYLSPANEDDSQSNRTKSNRLTEESIAQKYLLDSSSVGFYYRTEASIIEPWQLWDNEDIIGSRPHPPASPFGLHEGLYHDDTSHEIERYLRQMDDEDKSCSCIESAKSSTSSSSISTEYSHRQSEQRSEKKKSSNSDDSDQFNMLSTELEASSFEPIPTPARLPSTKPPIIIEKVIPKPISSIPILNPKIPRYATPDPSIASSEPQINYVPVSNSPSLSYRINERGEKITKDGNRIIFMDVVRPNLNQDSNDIKSYLPATSHSRSHRRRSSKKHVPIYDLTSINEAFAKYKSEKKREKKITLEDKSSDDSILMKQIITPDMSEILDGYFEDSHGNKVKLDNQEIQVLLDHYESFNKNKQQRKTSIHSSTSSSKSGSHHHRNQSKIIPNPSLKSEEMCPIPSVSNIRILPIFKQDSPSTSVLSTTDINHYIGNVYGTPPSITSVSNIQILPPPKQDSSSTSILSSTDFNRNVGNIYRKPRSITSVSSSTSEQKLKPLDNTYVINAAYASSFRYMQSSVNPNLFQECHDAY